MTDAATSPATTAACGCPDYRRGLSLSRRRLLQAGTVAAGFTAATAVFDGAFREVAYGAAKGGNVVLVLSLRGGCDGLSVVVPRGAQHDLLAGWRPSTVVPEAALLGDDPRFGLHPAFAPLMDMWSARSFGAVHAVGLPAPNRSHFEAMAEIEDATPGSNARVGWINRLVGLDPAGAPQSAMQLGSAMLPTSLVGPAAALGATEIADLGLPKLGTDNANRRRSLSQVWAGDTSLLATSVRTALSTTATFAPLVAAAEPKDGVVHTSAYPAGPLQKVLANTAALIRADLGTSMITVDYGNWDMHTGLVDGDLDPSKGWMHDQVDHLASSLKAFFNDLGRAASRVTVVTISEFGRRVKENGDRGVDHGYGNAMLLLGAGVAGGAVHGRFPGLEKQNLNDGDLALGQDYRSVLSEVVASRFPERTGELSTIFPGFKAETVGTMG